QNCFGGIESFEKTTGLAYSGSVSGQTLLQQPDQALTRDCINLCKQQAQCLSFSLNYVGFRCAAFNLNSAGRRDLLVTTPSTNYFEKICFRGVQKATFDALCGDRLWAFERAKEGHLEGFVDREEHNVKDKEECAKMCLLEDNFPCRSADYDEVTKTCRMSREDRRSQPQAFRQVPGNSRDYLENQCSATAPTSCRYETRVGVGVVSMDLLQFATAVDDCQTQCDRETTFNCRAYSYMENRCYLSGDDTVSLGPSGLPPMTNAAYGEKKCITEQCTLGVFTYEKMTGFVMRSAARTAIPLSSPGALGNTLECRQFCQMAGLDCPSFSVNYQNMRCDKLDRNSQGRTQELSPRAGENYFEKICLRGNFATACQGKAWAFERVLGLELVPTLYDKSFAHVQSRRDCEEYCLNEQTFDCRSAVYFDDTAECRLSRHDRRTQPDGVIKSSNPRINYLENQCLEVSPTCPYEKTADAYPVYTDVVQMTGIISEQSCESFCTTYPNFNCRSFAYYPSNGQCFISGEDRVSAGPASTNSRPGILFYERSCKDGVGGTGTTDGGGGTTSPGGGSSTGGGHSPTNSPTFPTAQPPQTPTLFPPTGNQESIPRTSLHRQGSQSNLISTNHFSARHCSAGDKLTFARVSGFESAARPGPILLTAPADGMTKECILRCEQRDDCRSFSIDYRRHECYIATYFSGTLPAHLRPSPGKTYFEGICVPERTCGKMWSFERLMNHAMRGDADREIPGTQRRAQCQDLCLRERGFVCRSATYQQSRLLCRLFSENRRTRASLFGKTSEDIDYLENMCAPEPSTCQYKENVDRFLPIIDRLGHAYSLAECQRQCDLERQFNCRAVNFETVHRDCALSSEDTQITPLGTAAMIYRRYSVYSEKGTCEQVSVQCNQQDMLLAMNFDTPFHGRVYAKGNPAQCFVVGNGQNTLQFAVSLGTRCGTLQEGDGRYANEVVVQQHPIIMTDTDRNIRVVCSFEAGDRTVTLASTFARNGAYSGLDVTTRHQPTITSVVTNTAPPPNVVMRILDPSGRDAGVVGLGDELTLKIEIQEPGSAFAIFARNLYARSSNGESLFLIDSNGCPVDSSIFPPLRPDYRNPGALVANFKAFRFPSSGMVNFEVQIRFCQDRCDPVRCQSGGDSFGRRRRDVSWTSPRSLSPNQTSPLYSSDLENTTSLGEEQTHSSSMPTTTLIPDLNQTDPDSAAVEETDPPIMFRKKEMYSPEEFKPNSSEFQPDSQEQPFGGYGMGYGRHYKQGNNGEYMQNERDFAPFSNSPMPGPYINRQGGRRDPRFFQGPPHNSYGHDSRHNPENPNFPPETNKRNQVHFQVEGVSATKPDESIRGEQVRRQGPLHNGVPQVNDDQYLDPYRNGQRPLLDAQRHGQYVSDQARRYYKPNGFEGEPEGHRPQSHPQNKNWVAEAAAGRGSQASAGSNETEQPGSMAGERFQQFNTNDSDRERHFPPPMLQEIVATTEKPYPEEVPLSLAIMVGEGNGIKVDNGWARNAGSYHPPRSRKRVTPRAVEEDQGCDPQNTIIITALVVSAIHVGLMLGGFFCFRWQRRSVKRKQLIASVMGDFRLPSSAGVITSAVAPTPMTAAVRNAGRPVVYGKADMSFRQMYSDFETPP
ncbi:unnamed protein product, partial [Ixodes persulcatus]